MEHQEHLQHKHNDIRHLNQPAYCSSVYVLNEFKMGLIPIEHHNASQHALVRNDLT